MLYFIGLGLGDPKDITVKGLEVVKNAKRVYLESYTSILSVGKEKLEEFYGREVIVADREMVEQDSDSILLNGSEEDIAFLVVGDPFGATTHSDMILRAIQKEIPYKVVHNASILNAVGCCGLQLYRYGETISIVFWTDDWRPDSFYDKIKINRANGLHTLCLLDIKVKEQSIENLIKGKKIYEPPRFMTVSCASQQLLGIIEKKRSQGDADLAYTENTICVGLARIGSDNQKIVAAPLRRMAMVDLGAPLHSLVICGDLHPLEKEMLELFADEKGAGDVIQQTIEKRLYRGKEYEIKRTGNMMAAGSVFGVAGHYWYRFLDKKFPKQNVKHVSSKLFLEMVLGPPIFLGFFLAIGLLEGKPVHESFKEFKKNFLIILAVDWGLYAPAQALNFYYVPPQYRMLYVCALCLAYDIFMSYILHKEDMEKQYEKKEA